jgi:hypothetical protein
MNIFHVVIPVGFGEYRSRCNILVLAISLDDTFMRNRFKRVKTVAIYRNKING